MIPARTSIVITHIAAWILFLSLPVLFVNSQSGNSSVFSILSSPYTWLFFITYIFIFYLNTWILLPKLYLKEKYFLYAACIVLLSVAVWILKPFDRLVSSRHQYTSIVDRQGQPPENFGRPPPERPPGNPDGPPREQTGRRSPRVDVVSIFLFIMILAMSLAIQIRQRLRIAEQRALKAEADRANAELSFLKAQINPHFLFNTLNNIYSLAAVKSDHTAESIMKLSNIMRYVTDDIREEYVPLENEVSFISDYIDLQRLRLGDKMEVGFLVSGKITGKKIAPLMLMTFIENVFKYGISKHEPSAIDIQLTATRDMIRFFCQNKLYPAPRQTESTGIGIDNTKQRLQYLYPGKHELSIKTENGKYTVLLLLHG
ncbi:MAG: sensor histidine kinase [Chitinophagaceae bacterium]